MLWSLVVILKDRLNDFGPISHCYKLNCHFLMLHQLDPRNTFHRRRIVPPIFLCFVFFLNISFKKSFTSQSKYIMSCIMSYFCIFLLVSFSELVQGYEKTVEFSNNSIPSSMENYFKQLASQEVTKQQDILLHGKRRAKRFITFNVLAPVDLGLLLAIPIQLLLPSMSNLFNTRVGRSVPVELEIYEDDPAVQTHLDRLSNYFDLLQIPDKACHQRAICEFSSSPEKYYPLSELILQRIRDRQDVPSTLINQLDEYQDHSITMGQNKAKPLKSLFKLYNKAADHGMLHGDDACHQKFSKRCPYSIEKRLNMPVLRFWNALKTFLKFTIKDTV